MDSWRGSSSGKFGLNFKQIVLMHINRCVINGSVEWCGGYWEKKFKPIGSGVLTDEYYVQNTRDVYCNSVRMLRALLLGYFDKKIEKPDKEIQEELEKIYNKHKKEAEEGNKRAKKDYNEEKVELHIRLFEELIMLSKRLNFFEEEAAEEDM